MSVNDPRGSTPVLDRAARNGSSGHAFAAPSVPSARLRKPRWRDARLVLGVVIVAISALVGAKVIAGSDSTTAFWAAGREIPAGSTITSADLRVVRGRLTGSLPDRYVADSSPVAGSVAVRAIGAGELIPRDGIRASGPTRYEFPLSVPAGNLPSTLTAGDHVDIWIAPSSSGSTASRRASAVWTDVVVLSVAAAKDSGATSGDRAVVVALSQGQESALASSLTTVASGQPYLVRRTGG